ncbi:uncharacterized protein LOC133305091 [Gastrolobium bilobum]|uniref:uncharacterized protein LOC133305091 n=1 Tax=Gastrolobium bilobum TaxID=150636 RepID=UPI002AB1A3BA|nr:uncharacterized protein LOC133305091 [Gastrolobium bilobum]
MVGSHKVGTKGRGPDSEVLQPVNEVLMQVIQALQPTGKFILMNLCSWNCRGVGKKEFPTLVRDLKFRFNIKVLALLETKIQGNRGETIIRKLGFPKFFKQEAVGFSGGIWILWDDRDVEVEIIQSHHQYVHTKILYLEEKKFNFVSFVYGSPRRIERCCLWEGLEELAEGIHSSWVILGDLNSVLSPSEKVGGKKVCWKSIQELKDCMESCGLTDIGFKGPSFTWKRGGLQERIDRALANEEWNLAWPNRVLGHLPYFNSDHRPILLGCCQDSHGRKNVKQFKFLAGWLTSADFGNIVKDCWEKDVDWGTARKEFVVKATKWHQNVYREEMRQKHRIYARIQGLVFSWKLAMIGILKDFRRTYGKNWTRRRFNKVTAIKDDAGDWLTVEKEMVDTAVSYFENLFRAEREECEEFPIKNAFPKLEDQEVNQLARMLDDEEIRRTVFKMGRFKAPGPDGLHAENLECMREFRPISLCNVSYKIVTKVITDRLRSWMPRWVTPNQYAFVKGRHSVDNILVAREIIHSMRRKKEKMGWMMIKVDLDKAYDRLSWEFIHETLIELGLPEDLVSLIDNSSIDQAHVITGCSGQKISKEKTRVFFSENVGYSRAKEISEFLGIGSTQNLGKYLGVMLNHSRVNNATFGNVLDRVNRRLCAWNAKSLSLAGRLTLAKSELFAMPTYAMQTAWLPKTVCNDIEKQTRGFIWGSTRDKRGTHLVKWERMCSAKQLGGVRLRDLRKFNQAFNTKVGFGLLTNKDALWARVLRNKYKLEDGLTPQISKSGSTSNIWRGICASWDNVLEGTRISIGNGRGTRFWYDCWVPGFGKLIDRIVASVPDEDNS